MYTEAYALVLNKEASSYCGTSAFVVWHLDPLVIHVLLSSGEVVVSERKYRLYCSLAQGLQYILVYRRDS